MGFSAYMRLMRFDKPMGTVLLWAPTAWALWVANKGHPSLNIFIYMLLGTILMRAAGCIINDIADRHIDKYVTRTKTRPIANNEVGLIQALVLFAALLVVALFIVLQLPFLCFLFAIFALLITVAYPFAKRYIQAPQLVLGLAFSMGMPIAFAASNIDFNGSLWFLCALNFIWIIAYDTMYAMADKQDDLKLGVKSTAILFASRDKFMVTLLSIVVHVLWIFFAYSENFSWQFYLFWIAGGLVFGYQQKLLIAGDSKSCFKGFLTNGWYGLIMWVGLIFSY